MFPKEVCDGVGTNLLESKLIDPAQGHVKMEALSMRSALGCALWSLH